MKNSEYEKLIESISKLTEDQNVLTLISEFKSEQTRRLLEPVQFMNRVCEISGCTIEQVKSTKRNRNIVQARHIIISGLVNVFEFSLTKAGNAVNRDHTSYYHSIGTVIQDHKQDKFYRGKFIEIFNQYPQILIERERRDYKTVL